MKKVVLFGSDGFIGMNIRSYFESKGTYELVCLDKNDCDLLKISEVKGVIRKHQPHFIINAAYYGGVTSQISFTKKNFFNNISICANIVHASALSQNLIFLLHFGSSLEYDQTDKKVHEKIPLNPQSYYATVKATTSLLFEHLAREKKIPYVLMRPFNLYGEHNIRSVIFYIITSILDKKNLTLTKGEQIRDFLYVGDFAQILHEFIDNHNKVEINSVYNIGSGKPSRLSSIFSIIFSLMKYDQKFAIREYPENEYWYQIADIAKLKRIVPSIKLTSLPVGITKTIDWVQNEKA